MRYSTKKPVRFTVYEGGCTSKKCPFSDTETVGLSSRDNHSKSQGSLTFDVTCYSFPMPQHRMPLAKAESKGAIKNSPSRYAGRKESKRRRPVGKPYANMTEAQVFFWDEFVTNCPWLHSAHRIILRAACVMSEKLDRDELPIRDIGGLSSLLSKLGATPVDETRVIHGDDGEEGDDPAAKYLQ